MQEHAVSVLLVDLVVELLEVLLDRGDLSWCLRTLKSQMNALTAEQSHKGYCTVDVIAHCFYQLGSLSLNDLGCLLVTGVKSQVNERLWIILHLL